MSKLIVDECMLHSKQVRYKAAKEEIIRVLKCNKLTAIDAIIILDSLKRKISEVW